jgi:uncharacterized protein YjbI with pentapeptide repeats
MQTRIQKHIRNNVVGYVAVFLALSGTAAATHPGGADTIDSADIINAEVNTQDLANNSVSSDKINNGAVRSADVADDTTANALKGIDIANASLTGADVADNSLTGADVQESSLGQVPLALLGGVGRTGAEATCDPESTTFLTCAATPVLAVPPGARALVLARVTTFAETGANSGFGECRLGTSSIGAVANTSMSVAADIGFPTNTTLVGITPPLPAGATSFGIDCNQNPNLGAVKYTDASASAVLISAT